MVLRTNVFQLSTKSKRNIISVLLFKVALSRKYRTNPLSPAGSFDPLYFPYVKPLANDFCCHSLTMRQVDRTRLNLPNHHEMSAPSRRVLPNPERPLQAKSGLHGRLRIALVVLIDAILGSAVS